MNKNAIAKAAVGGAEGSIAQVHNVGLTKHWVPDDGLSTNHLSEVLHFALSAPCYV